MAKKATVEINTNDNNFTNKFIHEIKSLDKYLSGDIIDEKTYKLRLNGRAKSFLQNIKTNTSYSDNYISKLVTQIRGRIKEINPTHPMLKYFKSLQYSFNFYIVLICRVTKRAGNNF